MAARAENDAMTTARMAIGSMRPAASVAMPKPARITAKAVKAGPSRLSPPNSLNPLKDSPAISNHGNSAPTTITTAPPISRMAPTGQAGRGGLVWPHAWRHRRRHGVGGDGGGGGRDTPRS